MHTMLLNRDMMLLFLTWHFSMLIIFAVLYLFHDVKCVANNSSSFESIHSSQTLKVLESTRMPKSFSYDHVFGSSDSQEACWTFVFLCNLHFFSFWNLVSFLYHAHHPRLLPWTFRHSVFEFSSTRRSLKLSASTFWTMPWMRPDLRFEHCNPNLTLKNIFVRFCKDVWFIHVHMRWHYVLTREGKWLPERESKGKGLGQSKPICISHLM